MGQAEAWGLCPWGCPTSSSCQCPTAPRISKYICYCNTTHREVYNDVLKWKPSLNIYTAVYSSFSRLWWGVRDAANFLSGVSHTNNSWGWSNFFKHRLSRIFFLHLNPDNESSSTGALLPSAAPSMQVNFVLAVFPFISPVPSACGPRGIVRSLKCALTFGTERRTHS